MCIRRFSTNLSTKLLQKMIYQHIWDFSGRELLRTVSAYPVWLTETSDLPNHNRFDPKGSRCPAFPCENYLVQTNKHLLDLNKLVVQQARLSFEISPCVCEPSRKKQNLYLRSCLLFALIFYHDEKQNSMGCQGHHESGTNEDAHCLPAI